MKTRIYNSILSLLIILFTISLIHADEVGDNKIHSIYSYEQSSITNNQSLLSSDPASLNFGLQPLENIVLSVVQLTNFSDALLMILSGETGTDHFTAFMPTWSIPVGESIDVPILFSPDSAGLLVDTLYVEYFGYWGSSTLKVPLQGRGVLVPPAELTATLDDNVVILNWFPPGTSSEVLRFGFGEHLTSIGTSNGTYEFAARFSAVDLMPYNRKQIDEIGFYITGADASFTLKVYTGEDADVTLISLPVSNLVPNAWNDIQLPFPITFADLDYLWIGYEMVTTGMDFIAGVDGGPAVTGSGDLLRINGSEWTTLSAYNLSHNWNIRGLLSDTDSGESLLLETGGGASLLDIPIGFIGYNVYRNQELLTAEPITALTFTDEIDSGETWEYGVTAVYLFGESEPATVVVGLPTILNMPSGWDFSPTPVVHNIHIPETILQIGMNLSPGDIIGVFYHDNGIEKCAGAVVWDHTHAILKAYGNDPATPLKDGFDFNEAIYWKVYMQQTGVTVNIIVSYDHNMPHYDGAFKMLGLSMLERIEMGTVGIENRITSVSDNVIYPNPSSGIVNLNGLAAGDQVNVYDNSGRLVLSRVAEQPLIQLNISQHGLYTVEIRRQMNVETKKLIISK